jgi:hypothetical protein
MDKIFYIVIFYLFLLSLVSYSFSLDSPSFIRHVESDYTKEKLNSIHSNACNDTQKKMPSLEAVSYSSNGSYLDVVYWLNDTINISQIQEFSTTFGLLIELDPQIQQEKIIDYMFLDVFSNSKSNRLSHSQFLYELFSDQVRQMSTPENINLNSIDKNQRYNNIRFDLEKIGYPRDYVIYYFVLYQFSDGCILYDILNNPVVIPPPLFSITTVPKTVEIRSGESKTVDIIINSSFTFPIPIEVNLFAEFENYDPYYNIETNFAHEKFKIPSKGTIVTKFAIDASNTIISNKNLDLKITGNFILTGISNNLTLEYTSAQLDKLIHGRGYRPTLNLKENPISVPSNSFTNREDIINQQLKNEPNLEPKTPSSNSFTNREDIINQQLKNEPNLEPKTPSSNSFTNREDIINQQLKNEPNLEPKTPSSNSFTNRKDIINQQLKNEPNLEPKTPSSNSFTNRKDIINLPNLQNISTEGKLSLPPHYPISQKGSQLTKNVPSEPLQNIFDLLFGIQLSDESSVPKNYTREYRLPIHIEPEMSFQERFFIFWSEYGTLIALVLTPLFGGIFSLLFTRFKKGSDKS